MAESLRYRAVLFDLDGTLVDSYAALADAVNYARRQCGLEDLAAEAIKGFVGDGLERLLQRAFEGSEVPENATAAFESYYDEICCEKSHVLADVELTLQALSASGVAMAVCTNTPTTFSRKILEFLNLAQFFRAIVGPDLAGARKPQAQHVLRTLEATRCSPSEALFVGDMPVDVEAARNSGIDVAVVNTGSSTSSALRAAGADHYLDRLADLVKIVRQRSGGVTAKYHLVFFDVDSTLVTIEGIDVLGAGNAEVSRLTEAAMNGEIPLDQVYERRLEMIRPSRDAVAALAGQYLQSIVAGAEETVAALRNAGAAVHLVTAGIEQAVLPLAERLGIPARSVHAVRLQFGAGGEYVDFDRRSPLTRAKGKELVVRDIRARSHGKAALVGDGASDLEAKPALDLFIGFGGVHTRPRVRDNADVFVSGPRLDTILPYLL